MKLKDLIGNKAYIYGTGSFALRIKNILNEQNIDVNAFLEINKEIYTFGNLPVHKLDQFENLDKRGLYFINILRAAGIFFDSAQDASDKINKIYNNVDLWWNSQKVQEARKIFCNQYSYVDDNKNYKALSHLIKKL